MPGLPWLRRHVGIALSTCGMLDGHEDVFFGNTVVLTGSSVGKPQCDAPGKTTMGQSITNYKLQITNSVKKGYTVFS